MGCSVAQCGPVWPSVAQCSVGGWETGGRSWAANGRRLALLTCRLALLTCRLALLTAQEPPLPSRSVGARATTGGCSSIVSARRS